MTEYEIYFSWKTAKRPKSQVQILADLNNCRKKDIQEIIDRWANKTIELPKVTYRKDIEKRLDELDSIIVKATKEYKILAQRLLQGA